MSVEKIAIAAFYNFTDLGREAELQQLRAEIKDQMASSELLGTVILADEGINSTVSGAEHAIQAFLAWLSSRIGRRLEPKISFSDEPPFRKIDVKIKPEIVTLKKRVDLQLGAGTHVSPAEWNRVISDPDVLVLDTRNDYEFKTGTFERAINPQTTKFSELPEFVKKNLDPASNKKVAMFCTGGVRCEKFAPYMRALGFENVYQLEGGILKYLEEVPPEERLWQGDCYVFDTRVRVNGDLQPSAGSDLSLETE